MSKLVVSKLDNIISIDNKLKSKFMINCSIDNMINFTLYLFKTCDIINNYKVIVSTQPNKSFVSVYNIDNKQIDSIINKFYKEIKNYVYFEIDCKPVEKLKCNECNSIDFKQCLIDNSIYICTNCNSEIEIFIDMPNFKDTNRVNLAEKYTYTRKGHFIEAMKKFQGIQNIDNKKVADTVEILKKEINYHNLTQKLNKPNTVTKDQVYMFLMERSLSCHYDDLNLFYYILTGYECPDISTKYDVLCEDFDVLESALKQVNMGNRVNSLSVNYKLYKLLQLHGYNYKKNDFYILKTKMKEDEHDDYMKKAWKLLGWEWIPTF